MKAFRYDRPKTLSAAVEALGGSGDAVLHAGGTDLLGRMKERLVEPARLVALLDVEGDLRDVRAEGAGLWIGALATLDDLARSDVVKERAPSLGEAAAAAASPQIRHRATIAGNLAQHTRCGYYRFASSPCFRRGATFCSTRRDGAVQEVAGVFANETCASAHPSSVAPVLCALDATVYVVTPAAPDRHEPHPLRTLWHTEQVRGRAEDLALPDGGVISHLVVPGDDVGRGQVDAYEEVRQRAAFDWALASSAVRLVREGDTVKDASVWLGAVAPTPWRATGAEQALTGRAWSKDLAGDAADAAVEGATPLAGTAYKVPIVRAVVRRAIEKAWRRT